MLIWSMKTSLSTSIAKRDAPMLPKERTFSNSGSRRTVTSTWLPVAVEPYSTVAPSICQIATFSVMCGSKSTSRRRLSLLSVVPSLLSQQTFQSRSLKTQTSETTMETMALQSHSTKEEDSTASNVVSQ